LRNFSEKNKLKTLLIEEIYQNIKSKGLEDKYENSNFRIYRLKMLIRYKIRERIMLSNNIEVIGI